MLISLGARHIVIVSRSGKPPAGKAQQSVEKWQAAGIDVGAHSADMADFGRLKVTLHFLFFIIFIFIFISI
jgi:hypothetical protein